MISPPRFLGPTQQVFSGSVTFDGENGTAGARAACRSNFASEPTARMCTATDVDRIIQRNDTPADLITEIDRVPFWALFHTTRPITSISYLANNTSPNNCHNLSYESGENGERGTVLRIDFDASAIIPGGVVADTVNYSIGGATCNIPHRLLCCGGS